MESFATPFPVYFDDGESSEPKAMGVIGVHSVLSFKRFQALLSQKISLPAGQLTAVFVCRRAVRGQPGRLVPGHRLAAGRAGARRAARTARVRRAWWHRSGGGGVAPVVCPRFAALSARPLPQGGEGDKRQKLPVNENTNFNIILNQHHPSKERDAHFLISVKKSKKDRKGAPRCARPPRAARR